MDPRAFVKVSIGALGLRIPVASKAARVGVHASLSPCFCEIRLPYFPVQTVPVSLITAAAPLSSPRNIAACFYLDETALLKLLSPSCFVSSPPCLEVVVFTGLQGSCCGISNKKLLGSFKIPVTIEWAECKPLQLHTGWTSVGYGSSKAGGGSGAELHINVKVEADPRYIFQFDGDVALSPQVVQIQGSLRQPIFSCKFSRDRGSRSWFGLCDTRANAWAVQCPEKDRKERKGWLVMIHDLSGSPVASASMVTPFVPSSGSDKVSRSNPGAWLILRPDPAVIDSWQPWGRLEAWRERGKGGLGLKFYLVGESGAAGCVGAGVVISECFINSRKGGEFLIDTVKFRSGVTPTVSPAISPHSSGDCSFNLGLPLVGGFVMSCTVAANRKKGQPLVQLAMHQVKCVEDAAVFLALSAAVDLSIDACMPFSRKMRREFSQSESPS